MWVIAPVKSPTVYSGYEQGFVHIDVAFVCVQLLASAMTV